MYKQNQTGFYACPRKLDSSYLSNGRLNPAVIRCNIEPAAGHLLSIITYVELKEYIDYNKLFEITHITMASSPPLIIVRISNVQTCFEY